jgi:hypothetical protein
MTTEPKLQTIFFPLLLFAITMGFLKTAIVIYLRDLYYPEGFAFPLKPIPGWHLFIELGREVCTLMMLCAVAWISGNSFVRRLSAFLFIFGTWDIFYYIGLWLSLGWPSSLLTWDILFLIPVVWAGPVLAPVICSFIMIGMAACFELYRINGNMQTFKLSALLLFLAGASVIFVSFIYDYSQILMKTSYMEHILFLPDDANFLNELTFYIPDRFQWELFAFGMLLILTGVYISVNKINLNKARLRNRDKDFGLFLPG